MAGAPSIVDRYAAGIVRARWLALCVIVGAAGWLIALGVPGFGRDGLTLRELAPADAPEIKAELTAVEEFRFPLNARLQVVRRDPEGLTLQVQRGDVRRAIDLTRAELGGDHDQQRPGGSIALWLPFANTRQEFPASNEDSTTTITNLVGYPDQSLASQEQAAHALADQMRHQLDGRISVTGGIPAQKETGRIIRDHLALLQALSILALVLVTGLWLRSVLVPVVVLCTVGVTTLLMLHALAFASQRGWIVVPAEVLPVVISVAIGIATDYVLFYLGAFRRLLGNGPDALAAAGSAIAETTPVILTAGSTTAIGAGSLLLADTGFIRAFAPGLVVACLCAIVSAMVVTPVLLAVMAKHLLWPGKRPTGQGGGRVAAWLTRSRPSSRTVVVATLALLAALASQVAASPLGFNIVTGLPEDDEVSIGYRDAAAGFAPGVLSPTLVLIEGDRLDTQVPQLSRLSRDLTRLPGVAGVIGSNVFEDALRRTGLADQYPTSSVRPNRGLLVTADGDYARIIVVLRHEAFTGRATQDLAQVRAALPRLVDRSGLPPSTRVSVAGDTALVHRVNLQLADDLLRVALALLVIEMFILLLALRSVRVAVFVVGASLAVTAAAVGSVSIADRLLFDGNGIAFFVPIASFVLLVSIGVDYGVLMGGAMARAGARGVAGRQLAQDAIRSASPTIVQAGAVLLVTFALLAVVPLEAFWQFAIVMSVGVALDTTVVRPVVMPLLLSGALRDASGERVPHLLPRHRFALTDTPHHRRDLMYVDLERLLQRARKRLASTADPQTHAELERLIARVAAGADATELADHLAGSDPARQRESSSRSHEDSRG